MATKFNIGDRVVDRSGYFGTVTNITHYNGSHWYDIRFERGGAVRYEEDLRISPIAYLHQTKDGYELTLCTRPCNGAEYQASEKIAIKATKKAAAKREAETICTARDARPWNF